MSAPAGEGSAAGPLKKGAELVCQLEDRVETCRLPGKAPGWLQAPPGRFWLPWERAPSGWAAESGRSAAGNAPRCRSDFAAARGAEEPNLAPLPRPPWSVGDLDLPSSPAPKKQDPGERLALSAAQFDSCLGEP